MIYNWANYLDKENNFVAGLVDADVPVGAREGLDPDKKRFFKDPYDNGLDDAPVEVSCQNTTHVDDQNISHNKKMAIINDTEHKHKQR